MVSADTSSRWASCSVLSVPASSSACRIRRRRSSTSTGHPLYTVETCPILTDYNPPGRPDISFHNTSHIRIRAHKGGTTRLILPPKHLLPRPVTHSLTPIRL